MIRDEDYATVYELFKHVDSICEQTECFLCPLKPENTSCLYFLLNSLLYVKKEKEEI